MEKNIINKPSWIVIIHALIQLDTLERLSIIGKSALTRELEELQNAMDEDYKDLKDENDEGDYFAHVNDEYIEVSETLPCLYWYGQLLIAYSFFERSLDAVCFSIQKEKQLAISLKDVAGQGITRSKTYLAKVAGMTNCFGSAEWQLANLFAEVRNAIAHRSGYIDLGKDDKHSLFYRLDAKGFELKSETLDQQDAQIILTHDLIIKAINVFRVVIKDIGGLDRNFETPKHGLPSGKNLE